VLQIYEVVTLVKFDTLSQDLSNTINRIPANPVSPWEYPVSPWEYHVTENL